MMTVDEVIKLDQSESCLNVPSPMIFSNEHNLYIAYRLRGQHGKSAEHSIALVKFTGFNIYKFGSPNDETIKGHPLYEKGLRPNGTFQVHNSSWMRALCAESTMVHPHYCDLSFMRLKHYVWSFHDSTLEVIAKSYQFNLRKGPLESVLASIIAKPTLAPA